MIDLGKKGLELQTLKGKVAYVKILRCAKSSRGSHLGGVANPCSEGSPPAPTGSTPRMNTGERTSLGPAALSQPVPLPAVLVPGLDLGVSEVERSCKVHAVLHTQVLLPFKAPFQLIELVIRESSSGFSRLLGPYRGTLSATRNLPVSFFLCSYNRNPVTAISEPGMERGGYLSGTQQSTIPN